MNRNWHWLFLMAAMSGCDFPGRPNPADRPVTATEVVDFASLYATRCAGCHGADGQLGPAPPLNDPLFLAIVPDAELLRVIREGRVVSPAQKTPMPAFARAHGGPLTDAQVTALAEGIKKRWRAAEAKTPPPYLAPSGTHGNREEGARVFTRACAGCHGAQGEGADHGAINERAFLALISDQALRRYIITGRPDLGMPPYDDGHGRDGDFRPLTSSEIDDLIALLAHWRDGGTR